MKSPVISLLKALIERPSITPQDNGCQDIVAERLREASFQLRWMNRGDTTNLWAFHGSVGPTFCFAGHTDVVPPGPREAWISDPFEAAEHDGFLVGRGAADMKSGVAAMTIAAIQLAREGHPGSVALLLTSDEEGSGADGTAYVLDALVQEGTKIDFALVGEPTSEKRFGDTIKVGRRGSLNGVVKISGIQGHTAYPQLADNAAHELIRFLHVLQSLEWREASSTFPQTTLQISDIRAGTGASNVIPGEASAAFNVRFSTHWTASEIQERIAALASESAKFSWQCTAQPFRTRSEDLIAAISAAIHAEAGLMPEASTGGGTSDARFFASHRIPVVEFGPINKTIHAANESVELASLEPLARIYAETARRLLS